MNKTLTIALIAAFAGTAAADATPCPEAPKPKVKKKKRTPATSYCKVLRGTPGEPGPRGPEGPPGKDGKVIRETRVVERGAGKFPLDLGVFGTYMGKHGDWAWGPALQVRGMVSKNYEASLMGGLAMGATSDRESGFTARLGVARKLDHATFGVGLGLLNINGSPENGEIDGSYVTLDATIGVRQKLGPVMFHLNLAPLVLGMLHDDSEEGAQWTLGSSASLFGSVRF